MTERLAIDVGSVKGRSAGRTGTVLIACVGYRFLRDQSVGPDLVPVLAGLAWPDGVEVVDLHFGPIHMVHWLEDHHGEIDRMVFLAAVARGREPGRVYTYRWRGELPSAAEVQARVCEGVTGIISLDNLLIVGQYFGALPADVVVVEVEPADTGWGPGFSPTVEAALAEVIATVRQVALDGYNE